MDPGDPAAQVRVPRSPKHGESEQGLERYVYHYAGGQSHEGLRPPRHPDHKGEGRKGKQEEDYAPHYVRRRIDEVERNQPSKGELDA